jgi:hypothetical protein
MRIVVVGIQGVFLGSLGNVVAGIQGVSLGSLRYIGESIEVFFLYYLGNIQQESFLRRTY